MNSRKKLTLLMMACLLLLFGCGKSEKSNTKTPEELKQEAAKKAAEIAEAEKKKAVLTQKDKNAKDDIIKEDDEAIDSAGNVRINANTFPDPNFRAYVSEAFDGDKNGLLDGDEIPVAELLEDAAHAPLAHADEFCQSLTPEPLAVGKEIQCIVDIGIAETEHRTKGGDIHDFHCRTSRGRGRLPGRSWMGFNGCIIFLNLCRTEDLRRS